MRQKQQQYIPYTVKKNALSIFFHNKKKPRKNHIQKNIYGNDWRFTNTLTSIVIGLGQAHSC